MKKLSQRVVKLLSKKSLKISFAESCTGGGIGSKLTTMPGSSKIFYGGIIAYNDLKTYITTEQISERTAIIASYALCGFANFGSIGIQIGGLGSIAPERRSDLAKLAFKAMIGGALASWITASIAGILI